jgi:hypothetical protein
MSGIFVDVNWLAVGVSAVLSFMLGAAWYSTKMFGAKWAEGVGMDLSGETNMKPPAIAMVVQMLGTVLLSWVIGVAAVTHALAAAILTVVMLLAMIASNGMWAGKSNVAIAIECGYIATISTIMIVAQGVLR